MKSIFWKDPSANKKDPDKTVQPANTKTTKKPVSIDEDPDDLNFEDFGNTNPAPVTTNNAGGVVDEDSRNYFQKIFMDRNIPGPDFFEFFNAEKALRNEPMPEATRYKAAAAGIMASGVTKQYLIDTGNKYISDANEKLDGFQKALDKNKSETIGAMQSECQSLDKENEDIEKQMIALNEKKNNNVARLQELHHNIESTTTKLNTKGANFEAAHKEHVTNIQETINKIQQYL